MSNEQKMTHAHGRNKKWKGGEFILETLIMSDTDSILTSIKKMIGPSVDNTYFDSDIMTHINTVFMELQQLGAGPENGFFIEDKNAVWTDFMQSSTLLNSIKTFMYLKVKLIFDPPSSTAAIDSINRIIDKLEWHINDQAERLDNREIPKEERW